MLIISLRLWEIVYSQFITFNNYTQYQCLWKMFLLTVKWWILYHSQKTKIIYITERENFQWNIYSTDVYFPDGSRLFFWSWARDGSSLIFGRERILFVVANNEKAFSFIPKMLLVIVKREKADLPHQELLSAHAAEGVPLSRRRCRQWSRQAAASEGRRRRIVVDERKWWAEKPDDELWVLVDKMADSKASL